MRQLRMLNGEPSMIKGQVVATQFTCITVRDGGPFHLSDPVAQGHALGELMTLKVRSSKQSSLR